MIIGTAGHIDHGKNSLIKAVTSVETSRVENNESTFAAQLSALKPSQ